MNPDPKPDPNPDPKPGRARRALLDAWAVLAPTQCSGCGVPDRALCASCRLSLIEQVHDCHRNELAGWAALDFSGAVRRVIGGFKDGGRTDAAAALATPLRGAICWALARSGEVPRLAGVGDVHLVTIPSSAAASRARGYHPVEMLLRHARLAATPVLDLVAATTDQVGLGREERARNKTGSLRARRDLAGFRCLVVDDIVTTGATILEARRAVVAAGGEVLGFVTLAETRRRIPDARRSRETG